MITVFAKKKFPNYNCKTISYSSICILVFDFLYPQYWCNKPSISFPLIKNSLYCIEGYFKGIEYLLKQFYILIVEKNYFFDFYFSILFTLPSLFYNVTKNRLFQTLNRKLYLLCRAYNSKGSWKFVHHCFSVLRYLVIFIWFRKEHKNKEAR